MKYLAVVLTFVGVAVATWFAPAPSSVWFFATQSSWSLLVIFIISNIMISKTVVALCALESLHIIHNLAVALMYSYINYHDQFIYIHYYTIIQSINAIEVLVLIYGVPWSVVRSRINSFFKRHSPISGSIFNNRSPLPGSADHGKRI